MLLKQLINDLQDLYDREIQDVDVMGEPEIMIDAFKKLDENGIFQYAGFSPDIEISYSGDGVYPILTSTTTWRVE